MTAEIAIMNKMAIALAADSAVTYGNKDKIYNSANKIFTLSKYHPVGIMIYDNAEFMGIPWEVIIKQYREYLGDKSFPRLSGYVDSFIQYLKQGRIIELYDEGIYFSAKVVEFLGEICRKFETDIRSVDNGSLSEEDKYNILRGILKIFHDVVEAMPDRLLPEGFEEYISTRFQERLAQYVAEFCDFVREFIRQRTIPEDDIVRLTTDCIRIFMKNSPENGSSGVVIAGFGEEDIFPALIENEIYGTIKGDLRFEEKRVSEISVNNDYDIVPCAQRDTVDTFLQGISPSYLNVINQYFKQEMVSAIDQIPDKIIAKKKKENIINLVTNKWQDTLEQIREYSRQTYINPVLTSVRISPKEDLAIMAESLVNLTSFKRQVSIDKFSSTVGGPIDVAVISKGDGFIWIRRKHYFSPELNYHFFNNYYMPRVKEVGDDDGGS